MANPDHLEVLNRGVTEWNEWRKNNKTPADLSRAFMHKAKLEGAHLGNCDLSDAHLRESDCSTAVFLKANAARADLTASNLKAANLQDAVFQEAILERCDLAYAQCSHVQLQGARLRSARLEFADFTQADLRNADLLGASVNEQTNLRGALVDGCRIELQTLERLSDHGGLTRGQMMTMAIVDPVAQLRAAYSGFMQWIHVLSLVGFLFPYLFFLGKQYLKARFRRHPDPDDVTLIEGLGRFIWTGGTFEGFTFVPFAIFCYALAYNAIRGTLLWKTKQLELQQECSGLPAMFSLEGTWWGFLFRMTRVMFWISWALLIVHLWHFGTMRAPLR